MNRLALLSQTACIWEASARKIGNVHPAASFADTEFTSFILSAAALSSQVAGRPDSGRIGDLVLDAVRATKELVGSNTNLGIILALAPLMTIPLGTDLRNGTSCALMATTVADTRLIYRAIRLANPGGIGKAPEQDVREEPTVSLFEAMKLAADRDLIARQYADGFADVFDFGTPSFLAAYEKFGRIEPAVIECQLHWLAKFPDSLIARKNGTAVAEDVRRRTSDVLTLGGLDNPTGRRAGVELDRYLRSDGNKLNPGTTADLVTACLFVALRDNKVKPADPFRWDLTDWL